MSLWSGTHMINYNCPVVHQKLVSGPQFGPGSTLLSIPEVYEKAIKHAHDSKWTQQFNHIECKNSAPIWSATQVTKLHQRNAVPLTNKRTVKETVIKLLHIKFQWQHTKIFKPQLHSFLFKPWSHCLQKLTSDCMFWLVQTKYITAFAKCDKTAWINTIILEKNFIRTGKKHNNRLKHII